MRKTLLISALFFVPALLLGQELQADSLRTNADSVELVSEAAQTAEEEGVAEENESTVAVEADETPAVAQDTISVGGDSEFVVVDDVDTSQWPEFNRDENGEAVVLHDQREETLYYRGRQPDAGKAVWFSAVLPGLGQIYNRQYWKLPIIYGGALGLAYAITWNNRMYVDYRKAYLDLIDNDPNTRSYENLLPNGVTIDGSNRSNYERTFDNGQETYLRYRDLCIICAGVLYILTMIDAYVDAQLFDYDISSDLSVQVGPTVIPGATNVLDSSVGLKCKLRF